MIIKNQGNQANQNNQGSDNIPTLRFPEFTGEWEKKKVGDVAPLQRGFDLPVDKIKLGEYPVVFSNGILKYHNEFKSKGPGVVTGRSGTIGKVTFVDENYWPHNTSLWVTSFHNNCPKYIYYFYSKYNLERFGTGSGVPTLNRNDIHVQEEFFPTLPEQTKIASFLTAVDEKIQQLKIKKATLEQYKKGVMQRLFCQHHDSHDLSDNHDFENDNNEKKLRFKQDNGKPYTNWQIKKLGKIALFFSGGTPLTTRREYFNGTIPFIRSGEINSNNTEQFISELGLKKSSAKMVEIGDILYALYGATSGEVGLSKINGAINQAILCIRSKHNHYYLFSFLKFEKENILKTYLQGGQGNLSAEIIKNIDIPLPCLEEQTKIANFLAAIDDKINLTQHQIEKTETWKKGLLQKMFV